MLPALDGHFGDRHDAVRVAGEACSWAQLAARADRLAAEIAGAPAVAVLAEAALSTVVAVVAALRAGVPVVPVPPDSGPREGGHLLSDSGAALLLLGGSTPAPSWSTIAPVPVPAGGSGSAAVPPPAAEGPGLILYTSGTTGAPKGVLLSRAAIAADLDRLAAAWAWTADDVLVHGLPLFHVHGLVLGVLGALRTGSRLVHTGRPTPAAYATAGGSLYFGVPTVWSRVCADPAAARALRGARLLVSGSAALAEPVFHGLHALAGHRPVERYGMTETLITVSARAGGPREPGWVGTALPDVETRVVDGELQVRGPTLFSGYLNRPDSTAETFTPDGYFRTGDLASIDASGRHRILGRASVDLIKSGGYRIGAGEVESALLAHPGVREAAVVGAPHADLGQEVVAFVVADGVTGPELVAYVADRLSVHKRPRRVHLVAELPRNALGKVQKTHLSSIMNLGP